MRFTPAVFAAPFLFTVSAQAEDLPARKPGLWELKMTFEGRSLPIQNMRHCVDQSTDKLMNTAFGGMTEQACSKKNVRKSGNTITIDSVCKIGGANTTSHAVITGSFDSAYTVKIDSTNDGGSQIPGAPRESHMTIDAKYLGACEAGQKPGDIIMGNGIKMNIQNMPKIGGGMMQ